MAPDSADGSVSATARDIPAELREWRKGLPLPVRRVYGWLHRRRSRFWVWDDPEFRQCLELCERAQWWTRHQLEELQLGQLRRLVEHAYHNVPYYRRIFDERRIRPESIVTLDDLRNLPVLTKEDIRRNLRDLVARNIPPERLYYMTTGGTTGTPVGLYHERGVSVPHEEAFMYRQWRWAGYRFGDRVAKLRGAQINHRGWDGEPAWWDFTTTENALLLSIYALSESSIPSYVEKLREFQPRFIQAYPSGLEMLARHMRAHGAGGIHPKAIFTEFEAIYPSQRKLFEEVFDCPVFAGYGHTERAADAVECEQRDGYHVSMEYGILELTDEAGRPVPVGEAGLITGTGLDTYCMPLIRYQTDDLARFADRPCPCGRGLPLIVDLVGRWQHDMIVTADDRRVPITSLGLHTPIFDHVARYQFYQERKGELVVRVVRLPSYTDLDTVQIVGELGKTLRGSLEVKVDFVPEVSRSPRGKHRLLDQRLDVGLHVPQ